MYHTGGDGRNIERVAARSGLHSRGRLRFAMKYVWIGLVLAAIVSAQFLHELSSGEGSAAAMCASPETQQAALRDALLRHLTSH